MSDQIGIQLSIARAVWAAHIHHASGLSAANMALQGKTAASVANWFLRHSELVLNSTLRRATLQVPHLLISPSTSSLLLIFALRTC